MKNNKIIREKFSGGTLTCETPKNMLTTLETEALNFFLDCKDCIVFGIRFKIKMIKIIIAKVRHKRIHVALSKESRSFSYGVYLFSGVTYK